MQPYVVRQGDYLAQLAYQLGFDADTVWNDPANQPLRDAGRTPDILWPTDVLYVPDPPLGPPPSQALANGQTNSFVSDPPTVTVTLQFSDPALASQSFTITELSALGTLTTGSDGTTPSISVPVSLQSFTVVFASDGTTFTVLMGQLDPASTLSGAFQRLQNLGYIDADVDYSDSSVGLLRTALRSLAAAQGASPPSTPPPASAPPPPPSVPAPASAPSPSSTAGPGSAPPPSSQPPVDDAGISDDGTVAAATTALLVQAYGC